VIWKTPSLQWGILTAFAATTFLILYGSFLALKRRVAGADAEQHAHMSYSTSKTALNALTVHYARNLAETSIKVNGAAPGHVATDFNGFCGSRTPEQGAVVAIRLAQLDSDGPTGLVFEDDMQLMW
jgi:NAD(P)-dependent dehydrogenase (short-subunit alcohol dehydrogenase family)